jgi:hypothetical protein
MPAKTFSEPISLTNQAAAGKLPVTYILTVDKGRTPEQDDFYPFYLRAQTRGWTTLIMEGDHNPVQRSHPKELVTAMKPNNPTRPASEARDVVVFIIRRDTKCAGCGEELEPGRRLRVENDRAPCMTCADLDHLVYPRWSRTNCR